jgi:hypothetical protein
MLFRKDWWLGILFESTGTLAVMYADFLIFRSIGKNGVVVDVLEQHAPNQNDLAAKLQGLCTFASQHGGHFGRIEPLMV